MTKRRLIHRSLIAFQIFALANCTGVSKADKARFTAVGVAAVALKEGAYAKPTFTTKGTADAVGLFSGIAGGLVGGLVAVAVVGTAEAVKQGKHKDSTARLNEAAPRDVHSMLTRELQNQLQVRPFFAQRKAALPNANAWEIKVEIVRYGLEKVASDSHSPVIYAQSWVEDPSGKKFVNALRSAELATARASIDSYASNPTLFRSHLEMVAKKLADDICAAVEKAMSP